MKIVAINGSPRGKGSVSAIMLTAFLSGAGADVDIVDITLAEKNVEYCRGCYSCWTSNQGCILDDDFNEIVKSAANTDIIVFASPVYFGNVTGLFKNFIDRLTSTGNPHAEVKMGAPKFIMLSNCGYNSTDEFEIVSLWIKQLVNRMNSSLLGEFYCPNGKQLRDGKSEKTQAYLKMLAEQGSILLACQ